MRTIEKNCAQCSNHITKNYLPSLGLSAFPKDDRIDNIYSSPRQYRWVFSNDSRNPQLYQGVG